MILHRVPQCYFESEKSLKLPILHTRIDHVRFSQDLQGPFGKRIDLVVTRSRSTLRFAPGLESLGRFCLFWLLGSLIPLQQVTTMPARQTKSTIQERYGCYQCRSVLPRGRNARTLALSRLEPTFHGKHTRTRICDLYGQQDADRLTSARLLTSTTHTHTQTRHTNGKGLIATKGLLIQGTGFPI